MKVDDYYVFWRYENNPNIYEGRVAKLGMITKNMKAAKPGDKVEVVTHHASKSFFMYYAL